MGNEATALLQVRGARTHAYASGASGEFMSQRRPLLYLWQGHVQRWSEVYPNPAETGVSLDIADEVIHSL
jgi:hypothetical protein